MRVLAAAQPFGFGPACSLLSILRAMSSLTDELEIHIVPSDTIDPLMNGLNFRRLDVDGDLIDTLAKLEDEIRFDLIVSAFDPAPVFYGWSRGITTALYDGLFNFWDFPSFEARLHDDVTALRSQRHDLTALSALYTETFTKNPHEMLFGAHYFADLGFVRKGEANRAVLERHPLLRERTTEVGCLMNPFAVRRRSPAERTGYVVSLSGSRAPIISVAQNIDFATMILQFARELAARPPFASEPWTVVAHPSLLDALNAHAPALPSNLQIRPSLPPPEFWDLIAGAKAVFTGCGYMAVEETAFLGTPTFILPEQNASHPYCLLGLRDAQYPIDHNLTMTAHMNGFQAAYGELDVDRMYADMRRLLRAEEYAPMRERVIDNFVACLSSPAERTVRLRGQYEAIDRMMGGFDGAEQIAHAVIGRLSAGRGIAPHPRVN